MTQTELDINIVTDRLGLYSLIVMVSLILKLQSTWLMFLACRKPFPLTTTWKDSGYMTHIDIFTLFAKQNNILYCTYCI